MDLIFAAPTTTWTIDEVIEHLSQQPQVDGMLLIGSLPAGAFNPSSDYDLVIVLHDTPVLLYVGVTSIDHRLTDLLFVDAAALEHIAALPGAIALHDPLTPIIRWLKTGQIVFDRSQRLIHAQQHVVTGEWIDTYPNSDLFGTWFATNYNLAQTRRLLSSDDPLYQMAGEIRMATHAHMDLWYSYFTLRRLVDIGEKSALRYLLAHDPVFLQQYQHFIRETDRDAKLAHYEQTAILALAPFGALWTADTTAMNTEDTLARWAELFEGK